MYYVFIYIYVYIRIFPSFAAGARHSCILICPRHMHLHLDIPETFFFRWKMFVHSSATSAMIDQSLDHGTFVLGCLGCFPALIVLVQLNRESTWNLCETAFRLSRIWNSFHSTRSLTIHGINKTTVFTLPYHLLIFTSFLHTSSYLFDC